MKQSFHIDAFSDGSVSVESNMSDKQVGESIASALVQLDESGTNDAMECIAYLSENVLRSINHPVYEQVVEMREEKKA